MLTLPQEKKCLCFPVKFDSLSSELISFHYWLIIKKEKKKPHAQQGLNVFKPIAQSRGCREKVQLWAAAAEPASGLHDNHLVWITLEKEQNHLMQRASDTSICFSDSTVFIRLAICDIWQFFLFLVYLWEEKKKDNRKCHSWPAAGRYLWLNCCIFKVFKLCLYNRRARTWRWNIYK